MPTQREPGWSWATASRLPPIEQPSSSTRQVCGARRVQPEQPGDRRQALGVALAEGVAGVGNCVVGGLTLGHLRVPVGL